MTTCNVASGWDPEGEEGHQWKTGEMLNRVWSFILSNVPVYNLGKRTMVVQDCDVRRDW